VPCGDLGSCLGSSRSVRGLAFLAGAGWVLFSSKTVWPCCLCCDENSRLGGFLVRKMREGNLYGVGPYVPPRPMWGLPPPRCLVANKKCGGFLFALFVTSKAGSHVSLSLAGDLWPPSRSILSLSSGFFRSLALLFFFPFIIHCCRDSCY